MHERKRKLGARSGVLLVAAAAASVLALVFAGSGAAGTPAGVGCAADGKIAGQGATLQTVAQQVWITGYTSDICGNVAGGAFNTEVAYNGTNQIGQTALSSPNGSGAGQRLTSCRGVPFGGTDIPYNTATLNQLDGTPGQVDGNTWYPGTATECSANSLNTWANPFFGTAGAYPFLGTSAATADQTANVMSFPVTGTAVAVGIYFGGTAGCPTTSGTTHITGQQLSDIFGGKDTNWNQLGGSFATCNLSIRRVVRADKSGTTQNFKNYLEAINPNGLLCDGTSTWSSLFLDANNQTWPTGGSCSPLVTGVSTVNASGNPGVLDTCTGLNAGTTQDPGPVPGSVCYADLPDFENPIYQGVSGFVTAELPSGATGTFVLPFAQHRANCDFSGITTPSNSSTGAVGLVSGDTWATDNTPYHEAVANLGSGWPACAVTFDLVYSGLSQASAATTQPNRQLNDDMRRSTYSYLLYVLGSGQTLPTGNYYQSIPQGLLNQEIAGFKANY